MKENEMNSRPTYDPSKVDMTRINNTLAKMMLHLSTHNSICVGVSGGSDSNIIVHMIATYFREFLPKVHFAFQNTGLEYDATLRHLKFMEEHYDIQIERTKGEPIPAVVKRKGFPIVSKHFSEKVEEASHGSEVAMAKINGTAVDKFGNKSTFCFSNRQRLLAEYLLENKISVSSSCCNLSKKKPYHDFLKRYKCDLSVSGERRAEGGIRVAAHTDCFEPGKIDKYMPLFFWNDDTKQYYKEHEGIVYSDCYEIWGMKRTGCVGCPFNSRVGEDLKAMQKYEPKKYKACMYLFGESYRLMDKFQIHRKPIFDDQLTFGDLGLEKETEETK